MSETPAAPELSGKMFLYDRPELLNPAKHGDLGVNPMEHPFGFVAKVRALPLTLSEVAGAARDYPVVFMSLEEPAPLAIVGLVDDDNLFVDDTGQWDRATYIPGYVRRYPFSIARETGGERAAVVIDAAFPGLVKGGEMKLFEGTEASDYTKEAIDFTRRYEEDRLMTQRFLEDLKKYDLLTGQTAQYTPTTGGESRPFAQYIGVEEQRLRDLPGDRFLELRNSNLLPILYAHLLSLGNWRALVQRRASRYNLSEDTVFTPRTVS